MLTSVIRYTAAVHKCDPEHRFLPLIEEMQFCFPKHNNPLLYHQTCMHSTLNHCVKLSPCNDSSLHLRSLASLLPLASLLRARSANLILTSGNYCKEKSNHFNGMGDILEGKNNRIKVDFNLQRKTRHGVFPCEILDVVQWMQGKQLNQGREEGSLLESVLAKVCF